MYFTSGAKVRTIRLRSWGSFVSRYCFHSASVSSWEMRLRVLGSSFIGSSGSFGRGGSRLDRPEAPEPLAVLDELRAPQWDAAAFRGRSEAALRGALGTRSVEAHRDFAPYGCQMPMSLSNARATAAA